MEEIIQHYASFKSAILIDYTIPKILRWTMTTMKETIKLLVVASLDFHNLEIDESQTLITVYFTPKLYTNDAVD